MRNAVLILFLFFIISKISYSQFYIELNKGYAKPFNIERNNFRLINSEIIYYSGNRTETYDTTKVNFAEGMYYSINSGYKINKYLGVLLGYEFMSDVYNSKFILDKRGYYSNISSFTSRYWEFHKMNGEIDTLYYFENMNNETNKYNYNTKISKYKIGLMGYYNYKKINIIGELNFSYTKIELESLATVSISSYRNGAIDVTYSSLDSIRYTIDERDLTVANNYTINTNYNYKKVLNLSYALGMEYLINNNFSLLTKVSYTNNNYNLINAKEEKNQEVIFRQEGEPTDVDIINETKEIEVNEQFFFPTLRFNIGIRYTFGKSTKE